MRQSTVATWCTQAGLTFACLTVLFALGLLAHTLTALTRRYRQRTRP